MQFTFISTALSNGALGVTFRGALSSPTYPIAVFTLSFEPYYSPVKIIFKYR